MVSNLLEDLLDISIALSAERDLNTLLDTILKESRRITGAAGGTIYLKKKDNTLKFMFTQDQILFDHLGEEETRKRFKQFEMKIDNTSMAGYVALTGEILNIPNVREIPKDKVYQYNPSFDEQNNYETISMLCLPTRDRNGEVNGVLQLVNALDEQNNKVPFSHQVEKIAASLASQAGVAIHNAQLNTDLKNAHVETILKLSSAAEYRDKETGNHIKRMSRFCAIIANEIGFSQNEVEDILYAAPMHDIGKLGTPDSILLKPGKLDDNERQVMNQHTTIGGIILSNSQTPLLKLSKRIALTHHEKWDGSGYPNQLSGEDIPIEGRIAALADVFDALSSKRIYKDPWPEERVLNLLEEERGKHFDPQLVDAFVKNIDVAREIQSRYEDFEQDFDKLKKVEQFSAKDLLESNDIVDDHDLVFSEFMK